MVVGCDQKLCIILSDDNTGTTASTLLLHSSEHGLYFLHTLICNRYDRGFTL